ncbi:DUF977 domain-containing protein [Escherichia coli]
MLPSETMIWQPEFTDKTLSRKPGAVHIEQLTQLFHSIVQFFRIGKNRLRITFVQRMNKAQQYLLHHVLGITKFLRVQ